MLKLALFIPGNIGGFAESKSLLPMADVARLQINSSPEYLRDYQLETHWFNTKVIKFNYHKFCFCSKSRVYCA